MDLVPMQWTKLNPGDHVVPGFSAYRYTLVSEPRPEPLQPEETSDTLKSALPDFSTQLHAVRVHLREASRVDSLKPPEHLAKLGQEEPEPPQAEPQQPPPLPPMMPSIPHGGTESEVAAEVPARSVRRFTDAPAAAEEPPAKVRRFTDAPPPLPPLPSEHGGVPLPTPAEDMD
eukprot:NODE_2645_length_1151_cov_22.049909_g2423_i0.p1 GENE.NODE_2645_length_1151_cov_22.049909_g2423_i0~~NODE_2645_length_1151_cov_22.049909_g2423_i0.p1  ORF type:complete len:173 (+),score=25.01 NODE_2645_length_1151_cov_22.049909_g2423_i0:449-967(+)